MKHIPGRAVVAVITFAMLQAGCVTFHRPAPVSGRKYNGPYAGAHLNRVAFPIGGIGAGMVCLEGTGAISHVSVRNRIEFFNEPCSFAAVCIRRSDGNVAKVLEGLVPEWKVFGPGGTGNGAAGKTYGLPRFDKAEFLARFPFATLRLSDLEVPLDVELTGWSPFLPGRADDSSLPVGGLEYRFKNTGREHYNRVRPHSALGYRPPAPEAIAFEALAAGCATLRRASLRPPLADYEARGLT
jgi:hypothetical protein